jgi:Family of unknown function (DUF6370)
MRTLFAGLLMLASLAVFFDGARAQDAKKEVTLKGKITCAKCDLSVTDDCATVIVVTVNKKDTVYYFDPAGHKKFHSDTCTASKKGSVTGVVSEEGKKKIVTIKSVNYD